MSFRASEIPRERSTKDHGNKDGPSSGGAFFGSGDASPGGIRRGKASFAGGAGCETPSGGSDVDVFLTGAGSLFLDE